ncbi:hypothetical protein [Streptomyces sp. NPDC047009]|uniref:hypothetical protein n=1 Tax=Streptomyces sp. NPDC047009 TaxID=3154496 RepID=UPI0033F002C7
MSSTSALMPVPPSPGLDVVDVVDRHDVTGADVRDAADLVNKAITVAFEAGEFFLPKGRVHGLTQEQFTRLACHCFYKQLFEAALVTRSLWRVAFDIHVYIGQLSD